ncbi:alpha/beta fold hydrolase [Bradyrhizobium sp. SYSU BS000235]|uniref:alpha/beta hydrolase family protein n=1 Tax=Bradyrhizobium sp. SYSU BS000235 TaxID=3411332 RepID=UPI003C70DA03
MTRNAIDAAAPRYDQRGWTQWPQNEEYSFHFMKVLGSAQEGGSTISECFMTASRIAAGDDESWYREWKRIADVNKTRGDLALSEGHALTAQSNWLRASNYYRTAAIFLEADDRRRKPLLDQMQACSQLYIRHLSPGGEILRIPCFEGSYVEAYFLRASVSTAPAPVVICVGGPDQFKDEHLYKIHREARARGVSLLLVDLPGQGESPPTRGGVQYQVETAISGCFDYLMTRNDVDGQRIVIWGDSLGAASASRAASADDRFAAAVCDAGVWDSLGRHFIMDRTSDEGEPAEEAGRDAWSPDVLAQIGCPTLVTLGEHDWLDHRQFSKFQHYFSSLGRDVTFKCFSAAETAASHAHSDNPTIASEYIFDWISSRLSAL